MQLLSPTWRRPSILLTGSVLKQQSQNTVISHREKILMAGVEERREKIMQLYNFMNHRKTFTNILTEKTHTTSNFPIFNANKIVDIGVNIYQSKAISLRRENTETSFLRTPKPEDRAKGRRGSRLARRTDWREQPAMRRH